MRAAVNQLNGSDVNDLYTYPDGEAELTIGRRADSYALKDLIGLDAAIEAATHYLTTGQIVYTDDVRFRSRDVNVAACSSQPRTLLAYSGDVGATTIRRSGARATTRTVSPTNRPTCQIRRSPAGCRLVDSRQVPADAGGGCHSSVRRGTSIWHHDLVSWLRRVTARLKSKRGTDGIEPRRPSFNEIAEQEREEQISEARAAALDGVPTVALREVSHLNLDEDLAYAGVDHHDRLVVASTRADPAKTYAGRETSPAGASFPLSKSLEHYSLRVTTVSRTGSIRETVLSQVSVAYPMVQPLPDGRWLVVGSRCHHTSAGPEDNAHIFGTAGDWIESFCIGDGVNDIQITPSGRIWASYHDEGVFGNFGWGQPHGPEPLGRAGMALWTPSGERILEYSPPEGLGHVVDCYALNVVGEDAWACYYTDFPIVRVRPDGSSVGWLSDARGPHSLVVSAGETVGLIGGYDGLFDRITLVDISDDAVAPSKATYQLTIPDSSELPSDAYVIGRGHRVHVFAHDRWFSLEIDGLDG